MDVTKSHAETQRAYRSRLKQQNPELLRMREREKWRRQCLKKRLQHTNANTQSQKMELMHQDICNSDGLKDPSKNNDINQVDSVKYCIRDLLRWLENVNVGDDVKHDFLKYIYCVKGSAEECNSGGERRRQETPNQAELQYPSDAKRIPIESPSESSSESDHEIAEPTVMPQRRKYTKKMRSKMISTRRKNTDAKQRKHITWEPLCFDDDGSDENYE